jgi:hypothetical protein
MPAAVTCGAIMDRSAVLLNDAAKTQFGYTVQIPFLKAAGDELRTALEENNYPTTNELNAAVTVTTAMTDIGGATGPALPSDLIELQALYERTAGSNEDYQRMVKVDFLPPFSTLTNSLIYYTWQQQIIKFLGANSNRSVLIEYVADTLGTITDQNSTISLFNAIGYLSYRTAALCASFVGENPTRAEELNGYAGMELNKVINIAVKSRQAIVTRRRPFMANYRRGY